MPLHLHLHLHMHMHMQLSGRADFDFNLAGSEQDQDVIEVTLFLSILCRFIRHRHQSSFLGVVIDILLDSTNPVHLAICSNPPNLLFMASASFTLCLGFS